MENGMEVHQKINTRLALSSSTTGARFLENEISMSKNVCTILVIVELFTTAKIHSQP